MNGQNGYGSHPTMYQSLSNSELYALYNGSSWFGLGETERQQLLQETVNRAAAQKGELGVCQVRFTDLPADTLGRQSGDVIEMNRSVFVDDKRIHDYNGRIIEEAVTDSNFQALETALHEDFHAWQNQCIDGTITYANYGLVDEYASNNFSVSMIRDQNGNLQPGSHYLSGENSLLGYYMYYFQSTERDAHYYSQKQAAAIGQYLQGKFGNDPSFAEYMSGIQAKGFAAMHQEGAQLFGNQNFDKEINQILMNQYYGTAVPVDPNIEKAVKQEMIDSYTALVNNNTTVSPVSNVQEAGLAEKNGALYEGSGAEGSTLGNSAGGSENISGGSENISSGSENPDGGLAADEGGIE